MLSKNKLVVTTCVTIAAALLVLTQTAGSMRNHEPNRLEGAWVARVPGTPLQWSYVMSPSEPSGRRAALSGSLQVAIPGRLLYPDLTPDFDYNSPFTGELVMTGPDTTKFTAVGYSIKKIEPSAEYPFFEQVAFIWVASGEGKFTAPDRLEVTHHVAYYLPEADANGDGLPDPDTSPFACLPATTSFDTRVGLMPPCSP